MSTTLLTFAPMIDSECARLVLKHHRLEVRERYHLFGLVSLLTFPHLGYGAVPMTYGGGVRVSTVTDLAKQLGKIAPDLNLWPAELDERMGADWQLYNKGLGTRVAVIAYYHLLPMRAEMTKAFATGLPGWERAIWPALFPLQRALFRRIFKLNEQHVTDSIDELRVVLDRVDRLVSDGRSALVGGKRTLSDLALASALAPMLIVESYRKYLPPEDTLPAPLLEVVQETRERPVAKFVERIYADLG